MSGQDMEHSCDERVLKNIEDCKRKDYAGSLALLAAKQKLSLTSFGSTAVRMRILNIASYKRLSLLMAAAVTAICIVFAVLLLTNPLL
jgi:beta-lactamase regulating signal transducer with metallopeptidase domain